MIFQTATFYIEWEDSAVPWLKIFTNEPYKELSLAPKEILDDLFRALLLIEREMIAYYKPAKINIASFGNYLPRLHFHIMARFEEDSHFPESMWGRKQREGGLKLPDKAYFEKRLIGALKSAFQDEPSAPASPQK
ncbi:MAG: HIT family protein [Helicobacteraceae bacterium]|jgi:diadenosine tetraphosphate (Ap4A) HIT family hydrolase|nr:HIT family protein [Helicobacteraceae bacterium]